MAMKTKQATEELLNTHYSDLVEKAFFPKLRQYMLSGPVRYVISMYILRYYKMRMSFAVVIAIVVFLYPFPHDC